MSWRAPFIALLIMFLVPSAAAAQNDAGNGDDEVLVRVNGSDRVEAGESVNVVVIVRGDLVIEGDVLDTTVVVDGDVAVLNGATVDGTLVVVDGTLTLRDGSVTTADIFLNDDARWVQEEGATFTGDVRENGMGLDIGDSGAWRLALVTIVTWLGSTLVAILAALVFAGVGGRQLWASARNLSSRVAATILAALVFWFGLLLIMVPLGLSGVGALAIPVLLILGLAIWFLGYIAFGTRIGATVTRRSIDDPLNVHPYLPAIAGTLILQLLLLIAMAGLLATALIMLLADDSGSLGLILGLPTAIVFFSLWLVGIIGGGALVLKAVEAWSSNQ